MGQAFTIHPGQIVLGTTLEFYRFPEDLLADVIGRSIWARRGLLIENAQTVHPLSSGTITLEMCNLGEVGLRLRPGVSIGQLVFHKVERVEEQFPERDSQKQPSGYAAQLRPLLGDYKPSDVEKFLLWELDA
jgi:deoxycytidine triphosphate deaminase